MFSFHKMVMALTAIKYFSNNFFHILTLFININRSDKFQIPMLLDSDVGTILTAFNLLQLKAF